MLLDLRTVRLKQLVTVKQAADELSVARQTVHYMVRRGALSAVRLGRSVLITRESLDAMRNTHRYGGRDES